MSPQSRQNLVARFVAREWGRLVGYVRARLADAADRDAEDIVQDVVEAFLSRPDTAEPVSDIGAYLYRSLRNRVVDAYRSRRPAEADIDAEEIEACYDVAADIEQTEKQALMECAIEDLPEAQRAVLVATEIEGRTFRELAAEWQVPIGTLLARKHRAVGALRKALGGAA